MRVIIVLGLIFHAASADAQSATESQVPPEGSLTLPPLTSASPEPAPHSPAPSPTPALDEEFSMPSFPSAPPREETLAPPPSSRTPSPPSPPARNSAAPKERQPGSSSPFRPAVPKGSGPSLLEVVTVPIGAGLLVGLIGSRFTDDRSTLTTVVLGTVGLTFISMVTAKLLIATSGTEPAQTASKGFKAMPVPVVLSAGHDQTGLAAGPGLFLRF